MRKKILYTLLLAGVGLLGQGCYEEDKLTASGEEPALNENDLPQGNHEYDGKIMRWWEDYALLTFYRFNDKEFWWTPTADIRPQGVGSGYDGVQADTNYVEYLVDLLDEEFFSYYTKENLNKRMPKKFLLMGELTFKPSSQLGSELVPKKRIFCHVGYDRFAINMANKDILNMTEGEIRQFRDELHAGLIIWQSDFGFIAQNAEFFTVTSYGESYKLSSEAGIRKLYGDGLISAKGIVSQNDWKAYVKAILTHSYDELTGEIDPTCYTNNKFDAKKWASEADQSLGMLNRDSKKGWDKSGKINEKYRIITTYFKEKYSLDLQAIGNGQKLND